MCKRCRERGTPAHFGDSPRCAFNDGYFNRNNWQCATMNALRSIAMREDRRIYNYRDDDCSGSIGVIHIPEETDHSGYLIMTWYKSRGCTSGAQIIGDGATMAMPLSLGLAERIIEAYEN